MKLIKIRKFYKDSKRVRKPLQINDLEVSAALKIMTLASRYDSFTAGGPGQKSDYGASMKSSHLP
jgi:hypothetical protein